MCHKKFNDETNEEETLFLSLEKKSTHVMHVFVKRFSDETEIMTIYPGKFSNENEFLLSLSLSVVTTKWSNLNVYLTSIALDCHFSCVNNYSIDLIHTHSLHSNFLVFHIIGASHTWITYSHCLNDKIRYNYQFKFKRVRFWRFYLH